MAAERADGGRWGFWSVAWGAAFLVVLAWSAVSPRDRFTWVLEVLPAVIGAGILLATRRRFPLTPLLYLLILVHAVILMVGGHYTYARVPLGEWARDWFGWARNDYDKLGHFAQGFVPALIARELLIRLRIVARRAWLGFLVLCICLAISALYELIEWWAAFVSGTVAEAFLGTQGYAWDTQSDMMWALIGAISALLFLGTFHDRQIEALERRMG